MVLNSVHVTRTQEGYSAAPLKCTVYPGEVRGFSAGDGINVVAIPTLAKRGKCIKFTSTLSVTKYKFRAGNSSVPGSLATQPLIVSFIDVA